MIKLGVIGYPISHSKSPLIHNYWIEQHGFNATYETLEIPPDALAIRIRKLVTEEGYSGFNLTVPHKELALDICDDVDDLARVIGAVNTIVVKGGRLHGTNTDMFGFIENIRKSASDFDFASGPAVVLGAGGAAKACLYGLLQEGVPEIRLINRTREKAESVANLDPRIQVLEWEDRSDALAGTALFANTTTLGMEGHRGLDIDLSLLPSDALVNDIVYAPLMTPLLEEAQARGNPVVTGIGMLLHQARPAFEAWFGVLPEVDQALEEKVLA